MGILKAVTVYSFLKIDAGDTKELLLLSTKLKSVITQ
jgi:hypothetical protein